MPRCLCHSFRIAAQKRSEHKAYLDAQAATWEQADKSSEEETYASPSKGKSRRRRKANPLNPGTHPSQESVRSTARTMLSVAQAVVCVSVAIVVGSMYYTKSEYGRIRPERFGLNLSDLPPGQGLSLRKRKAWSAKVDAINVTGRGGRPGEEAGRREERQIHTYSMQVLQPRGIKVNTACSARLQNHIGMYR